MNQQANATLVTQQPGVVTQQHSAAVKAIQFQRGCHFAAGMGAAQEQKPRVLPSYFTKPGNHNPNAWFEGWDFGQRLTNDGTPTEAYLIFAQSEAEPISIRDGFWSNGNGWTDFAEATLFTATERSMFDLPAAAGADAKWVPVTEMAPFFEQFSHAGSHVEETEAVRPAFRTRQAVRYTTYGESRTGVISRIGRGGILFLDDGRWLFPQSVEAIVGE